MVHHLKHIDNNSFIDEFYVVIKNKHVLGATFIYKLILIRLTKLTVCPCNQHLSLFAH